MRLILSVMALALAIGSVSFADESSRNLECSTSKFEAKPATAGEVYLKMSFSYLPLYRVCYFGEHVYTGEPLCYLTTSKLVGISANQYSSATGTYTVAATAMTLTAGTQSGVFNVSDRGEGLKKHTYDYSNDTGSGQLKITNKTVKSINGTDLWVATLETGKGKQKSVTPIFCKN